MAGAQAHSCPAGATIVPAHCDQPQSSDSFCCAVLFGHSQHSGWRLVIRVWGGGTMVERRWKGVLSLMVNCSRTLACHCGQCNELEVRFGLVPPAANLKCGSDVF